MAANVDTPTVLSLYSGGGGLDLGFRMAVPDARTVCYVERDAASIEVLVTNMQKGRLDEAPIWTDSGTFDGKPWRGTVDWIIGGFPCQPFSVAGAQEGPEDDRWLWPHIRRIAREVEPGGLFLENVPGLLLGGIQPVLGELAEDGYDAIWTTVRASDVGAPHRRERWFIMAYPCGAGYQGGIQRRKSAVAPTQPTSRCSEGMADTKGARLSGAITTTTTRTDGCAPKHGRTFPPGPSDTDAGARVLTTDPTLEPAIRGDADGLAARVDRLRILGNGVVPQQAALAFDILREQLSVYTYGIHKSRA